MAGVGVAEETEKWNEGLSASVWLSSSLNSSAVTTRAQTRTFASRQQTVGTTTTTSTMRRDHPLHYAELAAKRNECRRLTNCIIKCRTFSVRKNVYPNGS